MGPRSLAKLLAALLLCLCAAPALAAGADPEDALSGTLSTNWAGYASQGGNYSAVGATWVVPAVASPQGADISTDAAWVGVGGISKQDLIQAGTQAIVKGGHTSYHAWYELLPDFQQQVPIVISAGDKVQVSLSEFSPGLWLLSFADLTSGTHYYKALEYQSSHTSVEWVEEMPAVQAGGVALYAPLDEFGSLTFQDAYATQKGVRKTPADMRAHAITMVARNRDLALAVPSQLTDGSLVVARTSAKPMQVKSSSRSKASAIMWSK
jgi:hypothetical protein